MFDATAEALRGLVSHYGKTYPDCWKKAEMVRNQCKDDPNFHWPDWVYMPMIAWSHIAFPDSMDPEQATIYRRDHPNEVKGMQLLAALGAWRITQGIYRFDGDLGRSLIETPWTGKMIHDPFMTLPEYCIYIEHPAYTELCRIWPEDLGPKESFQKSGFIRGFFVHLDHETFKGYPLLRVVIDQTSTFFPFTVPLGEWTLDEAMNQLEMSYLESFLHTQADIVDKYWSDKRFAEHVGHLVSLCYYICSQNAEIGSGSDKPARPQPTKTKKGLRYFPADKPRVWDVGSRIGAALRAAKASHEVELTQDQHDRNEEGTIKERKRPRPHIRRAHWHTILSGPMTGARRRDVRWMPPTPVNIEHGEIIPTFHPVN